MRKVFDDWSAYPEKVCSRAQRRKVFFNNLALYSTKLQVPNSQVPIFHTFLNEILIQLCFNRNIYNAIKAL